MPRPCASTEAASRWPTIRMAERYLPWHFPSPRHPITSNVDKVACPSEYSRLARHGAPPVRGKGVHSHPCDRPGSFHPCFQPVCKRTSGVIGRKVMQRQLTSNSNLETLRKQAKSWLKSLRAGNVQARERLHRAWPGAPREPGLRDTQHALAREYDFVSWMALKEALAELAFARKNLDEQAAEFLELASLHYGIRPGTSDWDQTFADHPSRWLYAARLLARHPAIAQHSIHTAAMCGDLAEVQRILSRRPSAATEKGGREGWEPLLFVCYGRLPVAEARESTVAIATALLDAGAAANVRMDQGDPGFLALTGAIGGGEFSQPPHAQAHELAELLIERGADPYSPQVLYNTSLGEDDPFWLEYLYALSERRGEAGRWSAPSSQWPQAGMLDYLLGNAVNRNQLVRAQWLLAHGAAAQGNNYYSKRPHHTEAILQGHVGMADLLVRHGARAQPLGDREAFVAACAGADAANAQRLAHEHPEFLDDPTALIQAAEQRRADVATLLLDLGMSPDVRRADNFRPLHAAAMAGAEEVTRLLIDRGAEIDPVETRFGGVPLGWALHGGQPSTIALLGGLSRCVRELVEMGNLDRLRELLQAEPSLAQEVDKHGSLFFHLPDDEGIATDIAELLLAYGANPGLRNAEGRSGIDELEKRGCPDLAEILRSRARAG
ncbi:ankyrin repeat domain-containing protein [Rudaea sp.]|uniref:ankyrin repeat domain-containing protein n=1 Tax=Rudaea sp. TaxID=2136325 RepID=UPI002ED4D752